MRKSRIMLIISIAALFVALFACCWASRRLPTLALDHDHVTLYRIELALSTNPEAPAIREEIADGPSDLAVAQEQAVAAGILLTPPQFSVPENQDAAPLYKKWFQLQNAIDYPMYAEPLALRYQYTTKQIALVQNLVDENKSSETVLAEAVSKPFYTCPSDVLDPQGAAPLFQLRQAALQLRTEATLLGQKDNGGKPPRRS
jgi:hypothetical protein